MVGEKKEGDVMTFRWEQKEIEYHQNHIRDITHCSGTPFDEKCSICNDLYSILEGMKLTQQKYVYIKGQPDY